MGGGKTQTQPLFAVFIALYVVYVLLHGCVAIVCIDVVFSEMLRHSCIFCGIILMRPRRFLNY